MKDLGKWQIISFVSRGMAMVIGILQSFVIIRILSVSEWGIIQLAASIGGALGTVQHLGLASASTREIASAKDDSHIFKVFLTSAAIRYSVTIPLAILLFVFSNKLATGVYKNSYLVMPLKIYAVSLLIQGAQSILNSVISGTKRFKRLFTFQVVISLIGLLFYVPLVYFYRINGFFIAYFLFNLTNTILLAVLAFGPLHGKLIFPTRKDFLILLKDIFSLSIAIYLVEILSTNWEKLGPNILGLYNKPEVIAIFAFAMLYSKKILAISDAVTDVSLPVLSEKFTTDVTDFKASFKRNFDKVFGFIILASSIACFWAPQIISILVGSTKYAESYKFIPVVLLAFVFYSIIDIVKSSVYVPAKLTRQMVVCFIILLAGTISAFYMGNKFVDGLSSMSLALAIGGLLSLVYIIFSVDRALKYRFFDSSHWLILGQATLIGWFGVVSGLTTKLLIFPPVLILLVWALFMSKIFTWQDVDKIGAAWKKIR